MAKTLGPTARQGLGFWAQSPIILGPSPVGAQLFDLPPQAPLRATDYTWTYNSFPNWPPPPPFVDTTLEPRAPHFSPPRTPQWFSYDIPPNLVVLSSMAAPVNQYDWPNPRAPAEPATRTWTWSYNLNLIGQDALPVGDQVTALPPRGADPPNQSYFLPLNLNLVPPPFVDTTLEVRAPHFSPPRAPLTFSYDIATNLTVLLATSAPTKLLAGQQVFDLPLAQLIARPIEQTWTWRQVGMLGQDKLPVGAELTDLPPRAAARFQDDYGWTWRQVGMLGQDKLPVGAQRYELPLAQLIARPIEQTWTWRQVDKLGKDQLPVGAELTDLPPKATPRAPYYGTEWRQVDKLGLDQFPFNQYDWPNPRAPFRIEQTWALNLNTTTLQPVVGPLGVLFAYQYDALPTGPFRIEQTWALNLQTTTLQPVSVPQQIIAQSTELPRAPQRIEETWAWRQVDKLGQDQLPVGAQSTELTPKAAPRAPYYGTEWRQVDKLGQDRLPVGTQIYDTTAHRYVPYRPEQTTAWRQVSMLGQDRLPVGTQSTELTPKPAARLATYGTEWRQVGMLGLDQLPVGVQATELTPKAALRQVDLANWIQSVNLSLQTAPPDIFLSITKTATALPERGPWQPDRSFMAPPFIPFIPPPPVITGLPHNQPFINASMGRMFGR
jgi:hypothetical protein